MFLSTHYDGKFDRREFSSKTVCTGGYVYGCAFYMHRIVTFSKHFLFGHTRNTSENAIRYNNYYAHRSRFSFFFLVHTDCGDLGVRHENFFTRRGPTYTLPPAARARCPVVRPSAAAAACQYDGLWPHGQTAANTTGSSRLNGHVGETVRSSRKSVISHAARILRGLWTRKITRV